ncbi:hypothetical protein AV521_36390 [Streptomyces sp. IMTB 2501]|uniref:hypothetical protein n=1 Tax=Streptomyces sp. IMTB 2501 TaxID=1776340 RepID=UPI00096C9CF3|nr:hypothetical protein [Streptomyces sp. IMTB 2501]OLZ64255.1 hypothetical protein AV521_36390 [Streptomyces sp. IMTB 2501]
MAVFLPATSASAATGGCDPHIKVNGWDVGVCISDRNTSAVTADVYLNVVPGPQPSNCRMYIEIWSDAGLEAPRDDGHPCAARSSSYVYTVQGQPARLKIIRCYRGLHAHAFYYVGSTMHIGDSPHFDYGC